MRAAEHTDHAHGVGRLALHGVDRRGDGTQADLILAVFDGVAVRAAGLDLPHQGGWVSDGVRRELRHGLRAQQRLGARAGHIRQKHLALRRAVEGQAGADVGHDVQAAARFRLIERDDAATLAHGEHDGGSRLLAEMLHVGPRHKGNIPRTLDLAAVFKQPQPERILSVGRLRDHVIRPHGGQKAEHGALRIAALRRQILERQRLFRPTQKLQQLHRLRDRQYDISIHHGARPLLPSA